MVVHDSPSRFVSTNEAAQLLRISPSDVRKLIHRHELPAVRIDGVYRVDVAALDSRRASLRGGRS